MNTFTGLVGSGSRRTLGLSFALLALGAVTAALAFACSPFASVSVSNSEGPAGSTVTVSGAAFVDGGPVTISIGGTAVGTATGSNFARAVTVPALEPGVHSVLATGSDAEGKVAGQAVATFTVTALATPAPTVDTGSSSPPATGSAPPRRDIAPAAPTGEPRGERTRPARGSDALRRSPGRAEPRAPSRSVASPGSSAPATDDSQAVVTRAERLVFAGSVPVTQSSSEKGAGGARQTAVARSGERSARSETLPSLASPAGGAGLDEGSGSRLGIGIALLALGLVAPLAGLLVADVRRRRATVRQPRR